MRHSFSHVPFSKAMMGIVALTMFAGLIMPIKGHASQDAAKELVSAVVTRAVDIVNRPIDADESEQEMAFLLQEKKEEFRDLLVKNFHIETIARFSVGRYWRISTEDEQKRLLELVGETIINNYADKIIGFKIEKFDILSVQDAGRGDVVVETTVKPDEQPTVALGWRIREINDRHYIIDLTVEGVSMSVTHRREFSSVISRRGGKVSDLIKALEAKL